MLREDQPLKLGITLFVWNIAQTTLLMFTPDTIDAMNTAMHAGDETEIRHVCLRRSPHVARLTHVATV